MMEKYTIRPAKSFCISEIRFARDTTYCLVEQTCVIGSYYMTMLLGAARCAYEPQNRRCRCLQIGMCRGTELLWRQAKTLFEQPAKIVNGSETDQRRDLCDGQTWIGKQQLRSVQTLPADELRGGAVAVLL